MAHPDVPRILEAREAEVNHPAGWIFAQAQCKCKTTELLLQRDAELRVMQANLAHPDNPRTFSNFKHVKGSDEAFAAATSFARLQGPRFLVLIGRTGSGKSHLMEAIGRYLLEQTALSVRYERASVFLQRIRDTYDESGDDSTGSVISWYQTRGALLLDDLGVRAEKDWAIEQLTGLVDEREERWWTAISTNLNQQEMATALGERLASRLFTRSGESITRVIMTCGDYRMKGHGGAR